MLRYQTLSKVIAYGALIHKKYTAGFAVFIHKGLHSNITETACVSMLALKIDYNLGSVF